MAPLVFFFEAHESIGARIHISANDAAELRTASEQYVDSSATAAEGALWPLVRRVTIRGPWAALAANAKLVDAPGLRDDNSARDAVVKSALKEADALWFISNIRRAVNDKTVYDALTLTFRERCARERGVGDVVFVATQTDMLNRAEVIENLGLAQETSLKDVAAARNAFSRTKIDENFYQGVDSALQPINREFGQGFEFVVLACSAVDCQKLEGTRSLDGDARVWATPAETEVPALRSLLSQQALAKCDAASAADVDGAAPRTTTGSVFAETAFETAPDGAARSPHKSPRKRPWQGGAPLTPSSAKKKRVVVSALVAPAGRLTLPAVAPPAVPAKLAAPERKKKKKKKPAAPRPVRRSAMKPAFPFGTTPAFFSGSSSMAAPSRPTAPFSFWSPTPFTFGSPPPSRAPSQIEVIDLT